MMMLLLTKASNLLLFLSAGYSTENGILNHEEGVDGDEEVECWCYFRHRKHS